MECFWSYAHTGHQFNGGDDGFEMWFEENGEETLEELENE